MTWEKSLQEKLSNNGRNEANQGEGIRVGSNLFLAEMAYEEVKVLRAKIAELESPRKYMFVAYKPNSSDYCMGCHMASYSSDFIFKNHLTREELIEEWALVLFKNATLDYNEEGYEFRIFNNGVNVYAEYGVCCDLCDRVDNPTEEQERNFTEDIDDIHIKAVQGAKTLCEIDKKQREQEKLEKQAKELLEAQAQRKAQFEKLKQEFGNGC